MPTSNPNMYLHDKALRDAVREGRKDAKHKDGDLAVGCLASPFDAYNVLACLMDVSWMHVSWMLTAYMRLSYACIN